MAGFNWMDYVKGFGTGSQGASGVYSNMNQRMPGMGSLFQNGQKAGNTKYMLSGMNALAKGNVKEGIKSGVGYVLNQNPYIAALNTFNTLTGGVRFDKALGLGPKKPKPTASEQRSQLDYGQQLSDQQNSYLSQASKAADAAQRYDEYLTNERNAVRDLEQNGPSARSIAPMIGQFTGANTRAAGAARSSLASNLSQRGLSPSGGIGAGAMAAIETGLAANEGQQNSAVMNQVMDMLQTRRQNMMGVDAQGRKDALARQESMMDTAATLGLKGRELDLTQRRLDDLRSQQMFERRQAEQGNIGKFAGQFGPALLAEYQRYLKRKNGVGAYEESPLSYLEPSGAIAPEQKSAADLAAMAYRKPDVQLEYPSLTPNLSGTPTLPNIGPAVEPQYLPRALRNNNPLLSMPYPATVSDTGLPSDYEPTLPARTRSMSLGEPSIVNENDAAMNDVLSQENPYAMEGQIVQYGSGYFRKTADGWERLG